MGKNHTDFIKPGVIGLNCNEEVVGVIGTTVEDDGSGKLVKFSAEQSGVRQSTWLGSGLGFDCAGFIVKVNVKGTNTTVLGLLGAFPPAINSVCYCFKWLKTNPHIVVGRPRRGCYLI